MPHVTGSTLLMKVKKTLGTKDVNVYPFQTLSSWGYGEIKFKYLWMKSWLRAGEGHCGTLIIVHVQSISNPNLGSKPVVYFKFELSPSNAGCWLSHQPPKNYSRVRISRVTGLKLKIFQTTNQYISDVGKTMINYPFGNGIYHLFMVICRMVYRCFTHIKLNTPLDPKLKRSDMQGFIWMVFNIGGKSFCWWFHNKHGKQPARNIGI